MIHVDNYINSAYIFSKKNSQVLRLLMKCAIVSPSVRQWSIYSRWAHLLSTLLPFSLLSSPPLSFSPPPLPQLPLLIAFMQSFLFSSPCTRTGHIYSVHCSISSHLPPSIPPATCLDRVCAINNIYFFSLDFSCIFTHWIAWQKFWSRKKVRARIF